MGTLFSGSIPPQQQRQLLRATTRGVWHRKISVVWWILKVAVCFVLSFSIWATQRLVFERKVVPSRDPVITGSIDKRKPPLIVKSHDVDPRSVERKTATDVQKSTSSNDLTKKTNGKKLTVAYVATITTCGTDPNSKSLPFQIAEGAAVLRHSIARNQDRYDYQAIILYHPDAKECAHPLQDLGYTTIERHVPVDVKDIQGDFLREHIIKNGCCGEKELIKLQAWALTDYPIVVLLDLDTLVLQPMDRLFDFILDSSKLPRANDLLRPNNTIPETINVLYTTDYAMVSPGRKVKPTQGGFVVLRPSQEIFQEFSDIVRTGDFRDNGGWLGKSGKFWGAMTFQGLMPTYFQILHPGTAVELNWCVWDNMASPSRERKIVDDKPTEECFTQQDNCEDCRNRPIEEVALTHFTVCQKPWLCMAWKQDAMTDRMCRAFHHAWFQERSAMEQSWGRTGFGDGTWERDHNFGNCHRFGEKGYRKIALPYGKPV
jgi:hypothetical protein